MFPIKVKKEKLRVSEELGETAAQKMARQRKAQADAAKKKKVVKPKPVKKPKVVKPKPVKKPKVVKPKPVVQKKPKPTTKKPSSIKYDPNDGNTTYETTPTKKPSNVKYDPNDGNTTYENASMTTTNNNRPQSWFAKLLDYGLTQEAIRAQATQIQNQASQSGETLTESDALQRVAQQNNIPLGGSVGNQTGSAIDGIISWISDNFLIVAAVCGGVWLAFRPPPGSKRN